VICLPFSINNSTLKPLAWLLFLLVTVTPMAHWAKSMADATATLQTIMFDEKVLLILSIGNNTASEQLAIGSEGNIAKEKVRIPAKSTSHSASSHPAIPGQSIR
jgi:hypothetical protein